MNGYFLLSRSEKSIPRREDFPFCKEGHCSLMLGNFRNEHTTLNETNLK